MRGSVRSPFAVALFFVIIGSSCNGPDKVADLPTLDPATPSPAPTLSGAVRLAPEQIILPPEEFPLVGYQVNADERVTSSEWTRSWSGPGDYFWVRLYVTVLSPSSSSLEAIAATTCDWTFTPPALSAAEIAATVVGDGAKACGYDFQDAPVGSLVYTTGTRNVLVTVGVARRSATRADAVAFAASLADYQLWTIDRVAPFLGKSSRAAPRIERNTAVLLTPRPAPQTSPPAAPTQAPATVDVNPKSIDLGPHGGCGGAILQQRFDISAPPGVTWTVSWSGSGTASGTSITNTLDHVSGTGLGSATFTITLAPQKPSSSYSNCSLTVQFPYGDYLTFTFSQGGVVIKQIVTNVKYQYIGVV